MADATALPPRYLPGWFLIGALAALVMAVGMAWLLHAIGMMFGGRRDVPGMAGVWLATLFPVVVTVGLILLAAASWRRGRAGSAATCIGVALLFPPLILVLVRA